MTLPATPDDSPSAILFYDGTCGFCASSVQFVLEHERERRTLHFGSLAGLASRALHERMPELAAIDSLIWYTPATPTTGERVRIRSEAVLAIASYLGGGWRWLGWLGRLVPRVVRDAAYDCFARHRHSLWRGADASCLLPTAEQRVRFLDMQPS